MKLKHKIVLAILLVIAAIAVFVFHSAAIIVYPILALVLPVVFYAVKRRFIWLSIVLAVILDLMMYWQDYSYYEARGLFIYLTLAQIAVMAMIILILKLVDAKTKK